MKRRAYVYLIILIIVLVVSQYSLVHFDKGVLTRIVSYYGSIASVFGIVITLIEVYHAERIAKKTKTVIKETLDSFHRDEVLSTIVKAINECMLVLDTLPKDDDSSVVTHCRSLQDSLIVVGGEQNIWIKNSDRDKIKEYSVAIKLDIQTIERAKEGRFTLNKALILKDFENLRTYLKQLEQVVKNNHQEDLES